MGESTTQTLFKGEIVTVEPDFHAGGVAMVVRAYDKTHRMMRTRKQRSFIQQKSSDIIQTVCGEHGIRADVTASNDVHEFVLQHNETDFDFVLRLAKRIGYELTVDAGKAKFAPPNANGEKVDAELPGRPARVPAAHHRGAAGPDGQRARLRLQEQAVGRADQDAARSRSPPAGITRSTVANKFPGAVLEIAGQSFTTTGEADSMAQAALDQLANAYLAAEGTCDGDPRIKAGVLLEISGVGRNYSGTYRVAKSVHVIRGGGGYETQWSNSVGEHSLLGQSAGARPASGSPSTRSWSAS